MKTFLTFISLLLCDIGLSQILDDYSILSNRFENATTVRVSDIDNDGNNDLIVKHLDPYYLAWYRNYGNGQMEGGKIIINQLDSATTFKMLDIDGDSKDDILLVTLNGSKITWKKNLGNAAFSSEIEIIPNFSSTISSFYVKDNDNDIDIIISVNRNIIQVLENSGIGNFRLINRFTSSTNILEMTVSDVDNNGINEIIVRGIDKIYAYFKSTILTYNEVLVSSTNSTFTGLASLDLNKNGYETIISGLQDYVDPWRNNLLTVAYSYNDSTNHIGLVRYFSKKVIDTTVAKEMKLEVVDYNYDGYDDLLVTLHRYIPFNALGKVYAFSKLLRNDSSSFSYVAGTARGIGNALPQIFSFSAIGDMDNDGFQDMIVSFYRLLNNQDEMILLKNQNGTFSSRRDLFWQSKRTLNSAVSADLDGDGNSDILYTTPSSYSGAGTFPPIGPNGIQLIWQRNDANGSYGILDTLCECRGGSISFDPIIRDLNKDGRNDILARCDDSLVFFRGIVGGITKSKINLIRLSSASQIDVIDLDKDNDLDILVLSNFFPNNQIHWYENIGGNSFLTKTALISENSNTIIKKFHLLDIDQDGDLDILTELTNMSNIKWYRNNGNNTFSGAISILTSCNCRITPYDMNRDGYLDLLISSTSELSWLQNLSSGSFSSKNVISTFTSTSNIEPYIEAFDVDGDSKTDIIYNANDRLNWFKKTSSGYVSQSPDILSEVEKEAGRMKNTRILLKEDIDFDNDIDLLFFSEPGTLIGLSNPKFTRSHKHLSICDSNDFIVTISGDTITNAGIYYDSTANNFNGFDYYQYVVSENNFTILDTTVVACNSYYSPSGNIIYTSGIILDTLKNYYGYDSIIRTHLTLLDSLMYDTVITVCDEFLSASGKFYRTTNIYTDTILNQLGCDSVIRTNLTVHSSDTTLEIITACDYYITSSGQYIDSNYIFYDTLTNTFNCDSIIITNLKIESFDTTISKNGHTLQSNQPNVSYQWLDCNNNYSIINNAISQHFLPTKSGSYSVKVYTKDCIDTSACITSTVGIIENTHKSFLKLSPNPSRGIFHINYSISLEGKELQILDIQGKIIHQKILEIHDTGYNIEIPKKGVYLLIIPAVGLKETVIIY